MGCHSLILMGSPLPAPKSLKYINVTTHQLMLMQMLQLENTKSQGKFDLFGQWLTPIYSMC